jgi:hypothetical protein
MAKPLTENQKAIISQLKKEFEKINDTIQPTSSGLINVAEIKEHIILKKQFIAECVAQNNVNKRLIDKQVRADAEKLRNDLNELGLDVDYKNDGTCAWCFMIIKKDDPKKVSLMKISYHNSHYKQIDKFDTTQYIDLGIKLIYHYGNASFMNIEYRTIEEMVKDPKFIQKLKVNYEEINK